MGLHALHVHRSVDQERKGEDYACDGPDCNAVLVFARNDKGKGHYIGKDVSAQGHVDGSEGVAGVPGDARDYRNAEVREDEEKQNLYGKHHCPENVGIPLSQGKLNEEKNRIGHENLGDPDNVKKHCHLQTLRANYSTESPNITASVFPVCPERPSRNLRKADAGGWGGS